MGRRETMRFGKRWNEVRIAAAQRRLKPLAITARTRIDYIKHARWWDLEAQRGYPSSAKSREYGANMRWAAELTRYHGDGTWLELEQRVKAASKSSMACWKVVL